MSSSMNKDIKWMYEGTKSLVNREDYLLGKKIDKNLELFSDVIIKQKDDTNSELFRKTGSVLHPSNSSKTSVLDVGIVRTEDPLVALKLQQEQRKRQLLDNPLIKMKAERVLREAYEKEIGKKKHKKSKEKHRKHSKSPDYEKFKQKKFQRHSSSTFNQCPKHNEKKRLSEKELEEKRQAMISNAQWRDEVRKNTIEMAATKLRREEEQLEKAQSNSLRPNFGNAATASTSVAQRLQSKKHTLQRSHDCMERSFARK